MNKLIDCLRLSKTIPNFLKMRIPINLFIKL